MLKLWYVLRCSFHEPGRDLFSFARGLGAPSVHSMEANVLSRFAVDFLLSELTTLLSNMCPEMTPRIYRQAPDHHHDNCDLDNNSDDSEDHRCSCPKYKPGREPLKVMMVTIILLMDVAVMIMVLIVVVIVMVMKEMKCIWETAILWRAATRPF